MIVGQHDRVTPPATAVELVGVLPDATLVVVEHAGHMAMLERPAEVNHDIRVFARRCFAAAEPPANGRPKTAPQGRRAEDASRKAARRHGATRKRATKKDAT